MASIYAAILAYGRARLAKTLRAVEAAPPGGVLVYCHAGKDRPLARALVECPSLTTMSVLFETDRLIVRRALPDGDMDALLAIFGDPTNTALFGAGHP